MKAEEAFAAGISPEEFFRQVIPQLHASRLERFGQFSSARILFSVLFTDTQKRYSCELGRSKARVRAGEMVDFPVVSLEGQEKHWEVVKSHLRVLLDEAERRADEYVGQVHLTQAILDEFERFDGVIEIRLTGMKPGADGVSALDFRVVLNDYEADNNARRLSLELPYGALEEVIGGGRSAAEVARGLTLRGDKMLAVELGGFFLKHFERALK